MIEETRELTNTNESETSLLDMLVVIAENLKLLVLGPLTAGLVALGICYLVPQSYTSEAIIALPNTSPIVTSTATAQAAALMTSALVLDPVIASLRISEGRPIQVVRMKLVNQVKAVVGKDGLLRLHTTADSPEQAQKIGNAVISAWLKTTIPGAEDRVDLEKRLESAKTSLDSVERLLKRITTEGASNLTQPLTRGEAGTSIVAIGELQARFLGDVLSIPRALQGYSQDVVKQPPMLPTESGAPKKVLISVLATLFAAFLLTIWIFLNQAWRAVDQDPRKERQSARLRSALGIRAPASE